MLIRAATAKADVKSLKPTIETYLETLVRNLQKNASCPCFDGFSSFTNTTTIPSSICAAKKMYRNATPDYLRMTLLNVPAVLLVLGFIFAIDDITGFEITKAIELPPPWGVALLWGILLPTCFTIASAVTNVAFNNATVLKGQCPNCGAENLTFFGDVMTVSGNRGQNIVDCTSCGAGLTFDEDKRIIVVKETPEEKAKRAPPAGAKKGAGKKKVAVADE